jgi:predicted AlkP superfamily phosphohydrolase/phosphomutase
MKRAPRAVVIALDGTDPESIARGIDAGWLPQLAKAFERARKVELQSLGDLFLTSPWPCVASGVAVENHGIHAFRPIRSGTLDIVEPWEYRVPTPFWETAAQAGLKAGVVDMPICAPPPEDAALPGLRFLEWGTHPGFRPPASFPRSLIAEVRDRHGSHPFRDDDPSLKTVRDLRSAQARLCEGIRAREKIVIELLDHDPPDLLVAGFSEAHVAGHQFLNLTIPGHSHHDAAVAAELGEPLGLVYQAIDAAVGRILDRLPAETNVLVVCLGGVRVTYGGARFLDDILRQIGLTASAPAKRGFARGLWHLLPARLRSATARWLGGLVRRNVDTRFWSSFNWTATRAFALPWTYDGYLRVNQRGREPNGIVAPGMERREVLDQIEAVVGEMRIAGTDRPAARRVIRAQDVYVGRASSELPDLMVLWNSDRPLDAIESPRVGRISNRDGGPRGAHTSQGAIFGWGPAIAAGPPISGIRDIDIAPTVLALLGIAAPKGLDGEVVADLLKSDRTERLTA